MTYHHLLGPNDAHSIHSWVYATLTDRGNHNPSEGSADPITAEDVSLKRVCYVTSTETFYYLKALGPPVEWAVLGGGAGGGVIPESLVEFNEFGHDHSGGPSGAPISLGALFGLDSFIQEIHVVTADEISAGYFLLDQGNILAGRSVSVTVAGGVSQINKWAVESAGVTPDFDVLPGYTDRIYISNNGGASGLSEGISESDVLIVEYINSGSDFITEWVVAGDEAARTITLPLVEARSEGALEYDLTADWGDGTTSHITSWDDPNKSHVFPSDGTYRVKISGTMEGWSFSNGGDCLKITRIICWGDGVGFRGFKYLKDGFYGCTNLVKMPDNGIIPASDTGILSDGFYRIFWSCSGLSQEIPRALFDYHPLTKNFVGAFSYCSGLFGSIPSSIFYNATAVEGGAFAYIFQGCSGLTGAIPESLFSKNILAGDNAFIYAFAGCSGLTGSIPAGLFANNPMVSNECFMLTFDGCSGLTGSIPGSLFSSAALVTTNAYRGTFQGCTGLSGSIPENLFSASTQAGDFAFFHTFQGCTGLTGAIPEGLFSTNVLAAYAAFTNTFYGCSGLTGSIPEDLFANCPLVSTYGFQGTFYECSGLSGSIPENLFANNTLVTYYGFYTTFYNCSGLTGDIPGGLFANCVGVTGAAFERTFYGCINLEAVGDNLFRNNVLATSFKQAFYLCPKLQQTANIFYAAGEETTRFLDRSIDFTECFHRNSFTGVQGIAPDLWNCDFGTGTPTKTACFGGAGNSPTSLSNYASIPGDWIA